MLNKYIELSGNILFLKFKINGGQCKIGSASVFVYLVLMCYLVLIFCSILQEDNKNYFFMK